MTGVHEWFAHQVAIAHQSGKIPHGKDLPDNMPFRGDMFVVENKDGSDTIWIWWEFGKWEKGPVLKRPTSDH